MGERPVNNLVKATSLLARHEKSEWHLAAVEKRALSQSVQDEHGDVLELIVTASEEKRKRNRELMKKLIRSLYFLW